MGISHRSLCDMKTNEKPNTPTVQTWSHKSRGVAVMKLSKGIGRVALGQMKNSKAITKVKEELETKNSYNMGDY